MQAMVKWSGMPEERYTKQCHHSTFPMHKVHSGLESATTDLAGNVKLIFLEWQGACQWVWQLVAGGVANMPGTPTELRVKIVIH